MKISLYLKFHLFEHYRKKRGIIYFYETLLINLQFLSKSFQRCNLKLQIQGGQVIFSEFDLNIKKLSNKK